MKKKYAFYCSGNASRLFKFYEDESNLSFSPNLIFYDGGKIDVYKRLESIFPNICCYYNNKDYEQGIQLSTSISKCFLEYLLEYNIDYVFCFGDKILKGDILRFYKNKIINFHPSLLPSFKGLNAIDKALNSNVKILGNTAHFIDEGVDSGPIIMQSLINRDAYSDYEDVLGLQIDMLKKIWVLLENDELSVEAKNVVFKNKTGMKVFHSI